MGDGVRWPRPPVEGQSWRKDSKKKAKRRATETKGDRPETSCRISHSNLSAVTFDEEDIHDSQEHHDALIITLSMANCTVRKVLVDNGSSVNLIMLKTIQNMEFSEKDLQKKTIPLVGFSGETTNSLGEIVIPTYIGGVNKQVIYLVIDGPSTYNVILGRPRLHLMKAVPSTYHLWSTYQRLVNQMFKEQIGRTIEVYINNMVVKSKKAEDHMQHLAETFSTLRENKMKLNPSKCTFGVSSGKFLGYIVTQRGIQAGTEQIKAVLQLESPEKQKMCKG
ncbi:uncharacterized protein LOC141651358 [Silene latifolia]|uniref:uncharacterized protein LOC141651358 n=1 Tax=Silene latifolia TaxID=37657 RepID=UPI003D78AD39